MIHVSYMEKLPVGSHTISVKFDDYGQKVTTGFKIMDKSSDDKKSSTPTKKTDNVVTCQMAGFPANYAWNEAAKACQPGFIDGAGNFHAENTYRRYKVAPNTSDNGNLTFWMLALLTMTFTSLIIVKTLLNDMGM